MKISRDEWFDLWEKVKLKYFQETGNIIKRNEYDKVSRVVNFVANNTHLTGKYLKSKVNELEKGNYFITFDPNRLNALKKYIEAKNKVKVSNKNNSEKKLDIKLTGDQKGKQMNLFISAQKNKKFKK